MRAARSWTDVLRHPLPSAPVAAAKRSLTSARLAWSIAGVLGLALIGVGVTYVGCPAPRRRSSAFRYSRRRAASTPTSVTSPQQRHGFAGRSKAGVCADPEAANLDSTHRFPHRDAIAGTDGAAPDLFWSPDHRYLGFFTAGQAEENPCRRRSAATLCNVPGLGRGGAWNQDGIIVFGQITGPSPGIGERRRAFGRDQVSRRRRRALESDVPARRPACAVPSDGVDTRDVRGHFGSGRRFSGPERGLSREVCVRSPSVREGRHAAGAPVQSLDALDVWRSGSCRRARVGTAASSAPIRRRTPASLPIEMPYRPATICS